MDKASATIWFFAAIIGVTSLGMGVPGAIAAVSPQTMRRFRRWRASLS